MNGIGKWFGALAILASGLVALPAAAQMPLVPPGTVPFGVYDPQGDYADEKGVAIEHLFLPWEDVYLPSLVDADSYAASRNRALLVTIEPWTWSRSERNRPAALRAGIFRGDYDRNMRAICAVLGTLSGPVTVRWGHEMDDPSGQFIWSRWKPADYIKAYRRMIDICREEAPDIRYMWSPLGEEGMDAYYPGDDYVDLVGLSVFGLQGFDRREVGHDRTYKEVLKPKYDRAKVFGKPIVVAELGYSGDAAYVAAWHDAVRRADPDFPKLIAVVYFNQPEVYPWPYGLGKPDWTMGRNITR
ncbi:MAG: beta-mannosidase [Alphaproteobacteria bacterium]|nr:MAG: beta-mannosidase [Alphaproteobacteria bacterium]